MGILYRIDDALIGWTDAAVSFVQRWTGVTRHGILNGLLASYLGFMAWIQASWYALLLAGTMALVLIVEDRMGFYCAEGGANTIVRVWISSTALCSISFWLWEFSWAAFGAAFNQCIWAAVFYCLASKNPKDPPEKSLRDFLKKLIPSGNPQVELDPLKG
jgi:hypothetical protein